jgi:protein TonB
MVEEIQELDTQVQERMASQDRPQGVVGGVEGGVEGGVVGGVIGGVEGGVLGGQLGGSVATVHHSELQIKRRVDPEYPEAARDMNLGIVDCRVRIFIDEEGVPYDLVFESCPRVFHENARDAVMKTRWYPHRVGRSKSRAQFVIRYRFVPRR